MRVSVCVHVCVCMGMCERVCMGVCACGCVCMCRGRTAENAVSLQILEQDIPLKETDPHPSSVTQLWPTQLAFVDGSIIIIGSETPQKVHYKLGSNKTWNRMG